jgi:nascent polypeptide-associated complex subunit alpha
MFPGLNPKKMQAMMKQMGIQQEDIDANRVIIETDEKNIIINNPSVTKINMQGQENFQISGDIEEQEAGESQKDKESKQDNTDADIKTIMEKVGCIEEEAKIAYEKANKDLADAILSLS